MIKHFVLTLDGNAQRLSTLVTGDTDYRLRTISLQPGAANANPVFVGQAAVSATDYGIRLEAASASIPPAPWMMGEFEYGWSKLSDFYVIGTNTEKLHVLVDLYV